MLGGGGGEGEGVVDIQEDSKGESLQILDL